MTQDNSSNDMDAYNQGEIGTVTTTMKSVNVSAKTKLNGSHDIKLKDDTGSKTYTLTSTDLQ